MTTTVTNPRAAYVVSWVILANVDNTTATATRYFTPRNHQWSIPQDSTTAIVAPRGGTLSGLHVVADAAPGGGETWTFTLEIGGVPTGIEVIIADAAVEGADLVNTAVIATGDILRLKYVASAGAAAEKVTSTFSVH